MKIKKHDLTLLNQKFINFNFKILPNMVLNLTKKELKRMYGLTDWTFRTWINDFESLGLQKTKATATPKQLTLIIREFGFPPFSTEEEKKYLNMVLSVNSSI